MFYLPNGIKIEGDVVSTKGGTIGCFVNGKVKSEGKIKIAVTGNIVGNVNATDIILEGKITGNVFCKRKLIALKGSVITGDVKAAETWFHKESVIGGTVSQPTSSSHLKIVEDVVASSAQPIIEEKKPAVEVVQLWW